MIIIIIMMMKIIKKNLIIIMTMIIIWSFIWLIFTHLINLPPSLLYHRSLLLTISQYCYCSLSFTITIASSVIIRHYHWPSLLLNATITITITHHSLLSFAIRVHESDNGRARLAYIKVGLGGLELERIR